MRLIYVAGPYTEGDTMYNVRKAVNVGCDLRTDGWAVIVPHRNLIDEILGWAEPHAVWLAEDLEIISRCDAVFRIDGASPGADAEVAEAKRLGLPVFGDLTHALVWLEEQK
jgi:hypothetical protein